MRFYVDQGIITLINSTNKNRGYAQVVATNLKQRRMYARGNDDVDNKTSDEMTRKMGSRK
jgi:hypothetical protein